MPDLTDYDFFRQSFRIDDHKYLGLKQHVNDRIGFSTYRLPNDDVKRKLQIKEGCDYRSLFAVYFNDHKAVENGLQPLVFRMVFALYKDNEYIIDYSNITNQRKVPIDIYENNKYFYDLTRHIVCDKTGVEIDTDKTIEDLYSQHIKMTKGLNSNLFSLKYFINKTLPKKLTNTAINVFNNILHFFTGEIVESHIKNYNIFGYNNKATVTEGDPVKVDFFGLKVKIIPLFTYSLIHVLGFAFFTYFKIYPIWIKQLLNFNFLTVVYVITTYTIYTKIPGLILKPIIKLLYYKYNRIINRMVKP